MSDAVPFSIRMHNEDAQPHVYGSYYVSGLISLLFSIWLLYQRRSPIKLCDWNQETTMTRYVNAANFFLFSAVSYIVAGIVAQFCLPHEVSYYIVWSISIILHDLSLLYLITFIGPICTLSGWPWCPIVREIQHGTKPIIWIIWMAIAAVSVTAAMIYDLTRSVKQAGIFVEALVLIYFGIYTVIDGCFDADHSYVRVVWLYIDYVLVKILGFIIFLMSDIQPAIYTEYDMNFTVLYNTTNTIAMVMLFAGILYENKVKTEAKETTNELLDGENLVSAEIAMPDPYDQTPVHLDFACSDLVNLVDDHD